MIGGYFDAHHASWSEADMIWFETFLEEQDVDIMAWAMGTADVPERWQGSLMADLKKLNFVPISR